MSRTVIIRRVQLSAIFLVALLTQSVHAASFSDITDWIGAGSNSAAMEIDWNNGTTDDALVWGYHWNGSATGEQMFDAIVAADPRLFAEISGFDTGFGTIIFGLGYDQSGSQPFQLTPSLTFNSDHFALASSYDDVDDGGSNPDRVAVNAGDQWEEGWYNAGFWSYWNSTDNRLSVDPSDWDSADEGASDRVLSNGDWDGYHFSDYATDPDVVIPPADPVPATPVPEPSATAAILFVTAMLLSRRRARQNILTAAAFLSISSAALAADSVTIVPGSLTQGTVKSSLTGGTYADQTNNLNDWPLTTGPGGAGVSAISFENPDFNGNSFGGNPNTIIAFGNGGGVTLQFATPIKPVAGQKTLGIFTAQAISGGIGSLFNGDMDAAILVSADNVNWFTLTGVPVSSPITYTGITYPLNAPTMAYDYGTDAAAWTDGAGVPQSTLSALSIANFTTPMPDDSLFNNPASTNAQRLALETDTNPADYAETFGTSGGGNWFDISGSGLSSVDYIRLNGDPNDPANGGVRLDAVFAAPNSTTVFIPEPSTFSLTLIAGLHLLKRPR